MNGDTIGSHPQTQKLKPLYMSPELSLGLKGLITNIVTVVRMTKRSIVSLADVLWACHTDGKEPIKQ